MEELIEKLKNLQTYHVVGGNYGEPCGMSDGVEEGEEAYVNLSDLQQVIAEMEEQLTTK